ncbi:MAG TPA: gamma-glutamyltransferase family protein [Kofleriaceae bacterium]|nr:gamma-glutamyltransferase family protein [Kofleriaceae bacterium]
MVAIACAGCGADEKPAQPQACQAVTAHANATVGSGDDGDPAVPRRASEYVADKDAVRARTYMVVTDQPLASKAGCDVLQAGGSAIDAAIAVQMVLGVVEPQSSGIGGGAFLLYYDAATRAVQAYDGRETAPAAATGDYLRFVDEATDQTPVVPSARASGRSIGTPGVLRMLELAHRDHGRRTWSELFSPAIAMALAGTPIGGRLADAIAVSAPDLAADADAAATYLDGGARAKSVGQLVINPAYATTLSAIAAGGADAFYTGDIAQAIVDKIGAAATAQGGRMTPGRTTLADLAAYEARRRDPVCVTYRSYVVCGMPPPSSGGITVAAALGILEGFPLGDWAPEAVDREGGRPQLAAVHLVAEAERLAYSDRDRYIADADFVPLPGDSPDALLDRSYLATRAALIRIDASMGTAAPGDFGQPVRGSDATPEHGTTHVTIVDADGNTVAMTSTIESFFGSFHMARGFMLNNQLTDFSALPTDAVGAPIANRVEPGKRPRSSMAPTLVFAAAPDGSRGDLVMATGSPGGATIIQFVVKTLVGALDWGLDAQQSAALVDFGAANDPVTNVGGEHPRVAGDDDPLVRGLRALGHTVSTAHVASGIATIVRAPDGVLTGGADPRREGLVLGDAFRP